MGKMLDQLFLELSQVSNAETATERMLRIRIKELEDALERIKRLSPLGGDIHCIASAYSRHTEQENDHAQKRKNNSTKTRKKL